MPKVIEGVFAPTKKRYGIVASRFNEFITTKLIGGAVDSLTRHGVADENITLAWVPGAFEIPLTAKAMAASGRSVSGIISSVVAWRLALRERSSDSRRSPPPAPPRSLSITKASAVAPGSASASARESTRT